MLDSLLAKDIELFLYLNNLGSVQWDGFWLFITNKYAAIPLYLILVYVAYKQLGLKKLGVLLGVIVLLILATDQTSNLFKNGFGRLRPCHDSTIQHLMRLVQLRCGGMYSYFSAHAANSMAIAMFFSFVLNFRTKIYCILLISWAVLVGYSRIYVGVHFPLDVLTGMFIGTIYAAIFYEIFKLIILKSTI